MKRKQPKEMINGCCVCSEEQGWQDNQLVYCDGVCCNIAVHQNCYGIVSVPKGNWYCKKCESLDNTTITTAVRCELCPFIGGAFKRTDNGKWAHVVCALYIPEVKFQNVATMEPIKLTLVPRDRFNKVCYICAKINEERAAKGACMECNKTGCKQQFHASCAQMLGLLSEEEQRVIVHYCGYCEEHCTKRKKSPITYESCSSYDDDDEEEASAEVKESDNVVNSNGKTSKRQRNKSDNNGKSSKKDSTHSNLSLIINISQNPPKVIGSPIEAIDDDDDDDEDTGIKNENDNNEDRNKTTASKKKNKDRSHKKQRKANKKKSRLGKSNKTEDDNEQATSQVTSVYTVEANDQPEQLQSSADIEEDIIEDNKQNRDITMTVEEDSESVTVAVENNVDISDNSTKDELTSKPMAVVKNDKKNNNSKTIRYGNVMEELLERQWDQASAFIMEQAAHHNVAAYLSELHQVKMELIKTEQREKELIARRDRLFGVVSRLAIPSGVFEYMEKLTNKRTTVNTQCIFPPTTLDELRLSTNDTAITTTANSNNDNDKSNDDNDNNTISNDVGQSSGSGNTDDKEV